MNVGILLFEQYHGRKDIGSSRIRGRWLVKHWPEASLFVQGKDYDTVIYQKVYWIDHAKKFKGLKILDLCDPDWLHWGYKCKEMFDLVDGFTTSTEALAVCVRQMTDKPVLCIPDRVDLDSFKEKKVHEGDAKTVVWYGYSDNYEILKSSLLELKRNKLNLFVISNGTFIIPTVFSKDILVENKKWCLETVNNDILLADIVLNPQGTTGKWRFKSNNKTLTAWALGMPVAHTRKELISFIPEEGRKKEVEKRLKELKELWDVKISVQEMKDFIENVTNSKK